MASWIIGNWKLNPSSVTQATSLTTTIAEQATGLTDCQLMLAPSSVHLDAVYKATQSQSAIAAKVKMAAQDICAHTKETGAYTGDNSAAQLKDIGAQWVIIGHSERRQYYNEDNELLFNKVTNSLESGLGVIFCIGESESQYVVGETQAALNEQLTVISKLFSEKLVDGKLISQVDNLASHLIIAYEPVWAIGTGKIPSVDEVTNVHKEIRTYLSNIDGNLKRVPIIYGGSVKPDNAHEFASSALIDGVLVGGASLQADSFIGIARAFDS